MTTTTIQNNFVGGEISPSLRGRSDLKAYYSSAAAVENFIVTKEGSLKKRRGIGTLAEVQADYGDVKIVPYLYDRDEAGLLVLSYRDNTLAAQLRGKPDFAAVAEAEVHYGFMTPEEVKGIRAEQIGDTFYVTCRGVFNKVVTVNWAGRALAVSDYAQSPVPDTIPHNDDDGVWATHWSITRSSTQSGRTIYYGIIGVKDSVNSRTSKGEVKWAQTWPAGASIAISVTLASADAPKWDYIIVGKRSGAYYGELTRFYMDDIADQYYNQSLTRCWKSAIDGGFYTEETTYGHYGLVFKEAEVHQWNDGRFYDRPEDDPDAGSAVELFPLEEQTVAWHRYVFTDENHTPGDAVYGQTNVLGADFRPPLVVNAYQQRLVFANAAADGRNLPMTLWFSEIGNLYNFHADRPSSDEDPFSPTIMSTGPAFIRWLVPYQKALLAFTDTGIFAISGSQNEGFSASTCQISKLSNTSASPSIRPVETDDGIVFVGSDDKTLYTIAYDLQTDSTRPESRMFFAGHLTRRATITSIALQRFPDQVVWCSLSDGTALSFTFEARQEVSAWARHVIPGARILEVIGFGSVTDSDTDYTFGDIAFAIAGDGGNAFHIGAFRDDYRDVIDGSESAVVSVLTTLAAESQQQTIKFARKNVKDVMVSLLESGPVKVMPHESGLAVQTVGTGGDPFTGEVRVMPRGFISDHGQMTFISDGAVNCEILSVVYKLEIDG